MCNHMRAAGHRGFTAMLHWVYSNCAWFGMEKYVAEFIRQFLHCLDSKAGEIVPQPFGEAMDDVRPGQVLHFDSACRFQ